MRDDRQLDLFSWQAPCEVLVFPHRRLVGRARHVAEMNAKASPGAMKIIWKREVGALESAMSAAGIAEAERDRQIDAFTDLVRAEIVMRLRVSSACS